MNKTKGIIAASLFITGLSGMVFQAQAADPAQTLLCMAGYAGMGSESSGCSGSVNSFFKIVKFKHGKFAKAATSAARKSFLEEGDEGGKNAEVITKIISKYGKVNMLGL